MTKQALKVVRPDLRSSSDAFHMGFIKLESEVCDLKRMCDLVLLAADEEDGGSGSLLDFAAFELTQKVEKFKERFYQALRGEELSD
jgi:hypothetical protein